MPTASRGEPEITNWTFGVVTHIIITLSNMKSRYNYVATVVTESLKPKASICSVAIAARLRLS